MSNLHKNISSEHEHFMKRCIELAKNGLGNVQPNPMVGSVIVHNSKIIGEGFHRKFGEAHAEVNAINSVKNKELLKESTIYVNLEPCSHVGKTPACSKLIIEKEIPKVVIGSVDSFEKVSGSGIEMLKNAGCEVITGILEKESRELNKRFFTFHEKKRPYIILKWAQTADGFIDLIRTKDMPIQPNWITNDYARILVHKWRAEESGILIGTNTAAKDNPGLNIRDWSGNNPVRILLDRNLRLNKSHKIFDGTVKTIVFSEQFEKSSLYEVIKIDFNNNLLKNILTELYNKDIHSVIVEGGAQLHRTFIEQNLWDEARVFIGDTFFINGVKATEIKTNPIKVEDMGNSRLYWFRNKKQ